MKKSTKTFTGSVAALASVASIIAPAATVLAAEKTAVEVAVDAVAYAEKTVNFFDWNLAFGKVVALGDKNPQYFELLGRLAKIESAVKTPEVKAVLTAMDQLAANKDLTNFYNIYELANKVGNENNKNYLLNELNDWGKKAVFTPEVVAATDALLKAWTDKTPESLAAAKAAAAKLTVAGNLSWVNAQIAEVEATIKLTAEASAVGVKKLEVKFNKPVDTAKAVVTVNKGTSNVAVTKVTFAEDKLSAVVEVSSKMTEGKYTVKVAGVADAALVADVTVANESVGKIEMLSSTAVLSRGVNNEVTVGYQVLNQYGEKIDNPPTLVETTTKGAAHAAAGVLTIDTATFAAGDKFTVTLVESSTAKFVTQELTVASEAKAATIDVLGLYNDQAAEATTIKQEDNAKDFFLKLDVKDQFGAALDYTLFGTDLIVTSSNPGVVDATTTYVNKVNSKDLIALKLDVKNAYGDAIITIISKSTGKSVQYKVTVAERVKIDSVKIGAPTANLVAGGDTMYLPLEITDNKGNAITKAADVTLDDPATASVIEGVKIAVTSGGTFSKLVDKDGVVCAEVNVANFTSAGTLVAQATTETGKVDTELVQVKVTAKPAAIVGLDADTQTTIFKGEAVTLAWADLLLQDQYGRDYDQTRGLTGFNFVVSEVDSANDNVSVATKTVTADNKGTEVLNIVLTDTAAITATNTTGTVANSSTDITFRTVELSELSNFGSDLAGKLYANVGPASNTDVYAKALKVFGMTADGAKVYLPQTQGSTQIYNVVESSSYVTPGVLATGYGVIDGTLVATDGNTTDADPSNDNITYAGTATLTFVINSNGYEFTKVIDVAEAAPVAASVVYKVATDAVTSIDLTAGTTTFASASLTGIEVTDDYGVVNAGLKTVSRLTISEIVDKDADGSVAVANNGTSTAAVSGLEAGDSFKATAIVGGKTLTLTVNVK